jgi:hypothetical protein
MADYAFANPPYRLRAPIVRRESVAQGHGAREGRTEAGCADQSGPIALGAVLNTIARTGLVAGAVRRWRITLR